MLLARIYESQARMGLLGALRMRVFPLICAWCGEPMRIIGTPLPEYELSSTSK